MKRVLVAAALGGLLLMGTPTLASSAQRNDTKAEKGADKAAADKGGDKAAAQKGDNKGGNKAGDNKGGNRGDNKGGDRGDKGDRGDRGDRDRDGHHRHGYHRGDRYYYGGGYYYGEPYECWYGPSGAYNCEPYGGDYYGGGYHPGYSYYGSRNRNVYVERHAFNPPEVFAYPGQEVLWIFRDSEAHTVTADNGSFDSGQITQGEFRLIFEQPGSYSYHCALHPEMKGRVIVR
jgi:hypothetical protein